MIQDISGPGAVSFYSWNDNASYGMAIDVLQLSIHS